MITKEADSMTAMRLRMTKSGRAFSMDMKFYKNKGIAEWKKHRRYREVVQPCILHLCEAGTQSWWMHCMAGTAETWIL